MIIIVANIEVELRSFITKEQHGKLLDFFRKNARLVKEDFQETYYFDAEEDLRIQRSKFFSKIWMKKGMIHDEAREEIEIKFDREDFESLERLFLNLGYNVQIKWFRERKQFDWNGIKACLDDTKGYGLIIELEKICSDSEKEAALGLLKQKFGELGVEITPREIFEEKFKNYRENWRTLTS